MNDSATDKTHLELPDHFYRPLLENTDNVVWVVCKDQNRIVFINRDLSGVNKEKIYEQGFSVIWPVITIETLQPLLDAFERAVMVGERTENLRTKHSNAMTGEVEHYNSTIAPIHDREGRVSHIQVSSRDVTQNIRAQRTIDILNSVSASVQNSLLGANLFEAVGSRLKKHDIKIAVLIVDDRGTARLEYSSFPKRKMNKTLSLLEKEKILSGIPMSELPNWKNLAKGSKGQFFDDPHYYLRSRFPDLEAGMNLMPVIELLELKKIIVAPLRVNREVIGGFLMTSDSLSKTDLTAVKAFAMQFSHAIMYSRLQADCDKMRDLLHCTLTNTRDSIFATDSRGSIVLWNRASSRLFGYKTLDVIGENIGIIGMDANLLGKFLAAAKKGETIEQSEMSLRASDGSHKEAYLTCSGLEAGDGKLPGLIFTVTESGKK